MSQRFNLSWSKFAAFIPQRGQEQAQPSNGRTVSFGRYTLSPSSIQLEAESTEFDACFSDLGGYYHNALSRLVSSIANGETGLLIISRPDTFNGKGASSDIIDEVLRIALRTSEGSSKLSLIDARVRDGAIVSRNKSDIPTDADPSRTAAIYGDSIRNNRTEGMPVTTLVMHHRGRRGVLRMIQLLHGSPSLNSLCGQMQGFIRGDSSSSLEDILKLRYSNSDLDARRQFLARYIFLNDQDTGCSDQVAVPDIPKVCQSLCILDGDSAGQADAATIKLLGNRTGTAPRSSMVDQRYESQSDFSPRVSESFSPSNHSPQYGPSHRIGQDVHNQSPQHGGHQHNAAWYGSGESHAQSHAPANPAIPYSDKPTYTTSGPPSIPHNSPQTNPQAPYEPPIHQRVPPHGNVAGYNNSPQYSAVPETHPIGQPAPPLARSVGRQGVDPDAYVDDRFPSSRGLSPTSILPSISPLPVPCVSPCPPDMLLGRISPLGFIHAPPAALPFPLHMRASSPLLCHPDPMFLQHPGAFDAHRPFTGQIPPMQPDHRMGMHPGNQVPNGPPPPHTYASQQIQINQYQDKYQSANGLGLQHQSSARFPSPQQHQHQHQHQHPQQLQQYQTQQPHQINVAPQQVPHAAPPYYAYFADAPRTDVTGHTPNDLIAQFGGSYNFEVGNANGEPVLMGAEKFLALNRSSVLTTNIRCIKKQTPINLGDSIRPPLIRDEARNAVAAAASRVYGFRPIFS